MARPRIRRILLWIGSVVGAVVLLFVLAIVFLRLTNPSPVDSPGWSRGADMPSARGEVASDVVSGRLVVTGGFIGVGRTSDMVDVYDIDADRWTTGEPLPEGRHHGAAAGLDGLIYVSGGARSSTDWEPRDNMWVARPGGSWEELTPMPEGRQGHAMVAVDGLLYVVGGVGDTGDLLVYDPEDDVWSPAAALPNPRDHLTSVVWDGEIWAVGGRVNNSPVTDVHIYNPDLGSWRVGPSLPEPMSAMAVGVGDDGLHVVGGEDPAFIRGSVTQTHVALASEMSEWEQLPRPILAVHAGGYGVHNGRLWIAAGASRQGFWSVISYTGVTQSYGG